MIRETGNQNSLTISGQWINKYTQEVVTVMNNVIEGDKMTLITDKGAIDMNDFGDYIQMEAGHEMPNNQPVNTSQQYKDLIVEDDDITAINNIASPKSISAGDLYIPSRSESTSKPEPPKSKNNQILEKFFNKIPNIDKLLQISIDESVIPINDLTTIVNYMDIKIDDISNYIIDNILDKKYIAKILNAEIHALFGEDITSEIEIINEQSDES